MLSDEAGILHDFLCKDGRELRNFKLMVGTGKDITKDMILAEAKRVLEIVFSSELVDKPPHSNQKKVVF